jgi:hypothetical protein
MVPKNQHGTLLEPLNQFKLSKPELYQEKAQKYIGREHIIEHTIPILNCLWNDVLHLSPIAPKDLKAALLEAGMPDQEMRFYEIGPTTLNQDQLVTFLYQEMNELHEADFERFDTTKLSALSVVPEKTKKYYKEQYAKGEKPLRFLGIPHILYRGTIDVNKASVITV